MNLFKILTKKRKLVNKQTNLTFTDLTNALTIILKCKFKSLETDLVNFQLLDNYNRQNLFEVVMINEGNFIASLYASAYLIDYADAFTLVLRAFHAAKEEIFKEVPVSNLVHFSRGLEK